MVNLNFSQTLVLKMQASISNNFILTSKKHVNVECIFNCFPTDWDLDDLLDDEPVLSLHLKCYIRIPAGMPVKPSLHSHNLTEPLRPVSPSKSKSFLLHYQRASTVCQNYLQVEVAKLTSLILHNSMDCRVETVMDGIIWIWSKSTQCQRAIGMSKVGRNRVRKKRTLVWKYNLHLLFSPPTKECYKKIKAIKK